MNLTPSQSAELERRLDTLGREVRDKIRGTLPESADQKFIDFVGVVHDLGDEALISTLEQLDHARLERYLAELREIEAARARLARGDANSCVACGSEIGYRRLEAYPLAARCIECQIRHEKMHRDSLTPKT